MPQQLVEVYLETGCQTELLSFSVTAEKQIVDKFFNRTVAALVTVIVALTLVPLMFFMNEYRKHSLSDI